MIKFLKKVSFVYMADTPWCGNEANKLYIQSGQFDSALKTSEDIGSIDINPLDISYDGTNTPWCGYTDQKLYLQSGQFTSTLKDSENINGIDISIAGISWDGVDTPWCGFTDIKLYLQSGQYTSTLKTSEYVGGIDTGPLSISYDGKNTPWTGNTDQKLYLTSGQFTSTLNDSELIGLIDNDPRGISYDGTNTPWSGNETDILYLQSGQFTSTIKDSQSVNSIDIYLEGICTNDVTGRLVGVGDIYEKSVSNTISLGQSVSPTGSIFSRSRSNTISLGQSVSQAGSIYSRSRSNNISLGQSVSPAGSIYSRSLSNTISLGHSVSIIYNTPWSGIEATKLYLQSGQFTSTVKTSETVGGIDIYPQDLTWDGINTPWCGSEAAKLYLTSGQFTSTIKDSEDVSGIDVNLQGISWDGIDTPWCGADDNKLYLQSGQFTSTIKTSEAVGGIDLSPQGVSWDSINTPWVGSADDKLYLTSGQFTSTLKDSEDVSGIDNVPLGVSWDGTNTPWVGYQANKLYLQSGQFTSTLKTSEAVGGIDTTPTGICVNDINSRLSIGTIYDRPLENTITLGQSVSQVGSIFSRSLDNTIVLGQSETTTPIYNRDFENTIILEQGVITVKHFKSLSSTISLTQDIDYERLRPIGDVYNKTFYNNVAFSQDVDYDLILSTGETYSGRVIDTISGLEHQFIINGIYNRELSNTITFAQNLPKEEVTDYLLDIPRWITASTSEYFNQIAITNNLHFFVEGTHRETSEHQKFIEFRLDGPDTTQISKNYYKFDININMLWSFNQDDEDFYTSERIKGLLMDAMNDICVYKYGTIGDNSFIGTLQVKQVRVNNFGQVRSDVKLMQGTVEGTYSLIVYLPDLIDSPILPIDLTVDSKIKNIAQWIMASVNVHFSEIATANSLYYFTEGMHRETSEHKKYIECRLDGPNTTQISKNYYRFDVEINILWTFNQNEDLHGPERIKGVLLKAMNDICVRRYGDDGSFLGTLQLKQNPVRVNNLGQIKADVKLMQGTVEGSYSLYFTAN